MASQGLQSGPCANSTSFSLRGGLFLLCSFDNALMRIGELGFQEALDSFLCLARPISHSLFTSPYLYEAGLKKDLMVAYFGPKIIPVK